MLRTGWTTGRVFLQRFLAFEHSVLARFNRCACYFVSTSCEQICLRVGKRCERWQLALELRALCSQRSATLTAVDGYHGGS